MDSAQTVDPDPLLAWKIQTQEQWDSLADPNSGFVDPSAAWKHFENLFVSRDYSVCYWKVTELRRPKVYISKGDNPFQPSASSAFVHSVSENFESFAKSNTSYRWRSSFPNIAHAYDALDRQVVIKALEHSNPSSELEIISYLNTGALRLAPQNHTIPLLDHFEAEGWHFLVMPAWNMNISQSFLTWQVDDYFRMAIQAFEGLSFMHQNGIAHRDISGGNILFNQDGTHGTSSRVPVPILSAWDSRLAFIDFGFSKKFDSGSDPKTWVASDYVGKPSNMAPEITAAQFGKVEFQLLPVDVYALAKVLMRFVESEQEQIAVYRKYPSQTVREPSTYASDVLAKSVPQYVQILNDMLNDDPSQRPTAAEASSRFEALRKTLPDDILFLPHDAESYTEHPSITTDS